MTNREKAIVAAIVLVGLSLRLIGVDSFPANERELLGGGWPSVAGAPPLWVGRAVSAALAGIALLAIAWPRTNDPGLGTIAGILFALDPLSILAAHESPRASLLQLGGALLVRAIGRGSGPFVAIAAVAVLGAALLTPGTIESVAPSPALAAWYGEDHHPFAAPLAAIHHLGYAALPLALGGFLALRGGAGIMIAAGLALAGFAPGAALTDFAVVSPAVAVAAATTIGKLRAREAELGRRPLVVPGAILLVVAVNAPALVSDAATGLRYPWNAVRTWLASRADLDPTSTIVVTTDPDLARDALGANWTVEPIGPDDVLDPEANPQNAATKTRVVVVPVSSGIQSGRTGDPPWLEIAERRKVPDFAPLARRFDLYRLELRVFVFPR